MRIHFSFWVVKQHKRGFLQWIWVAYVESCVEGLEEPQCSAELGLPLLSPSPFCPTAANLGSKNSSDDRGHVWGRNALQWVLQWQSPPCLSTATRESCALCPHSVNPLGHPAQSPAEWPMCHSHSCPPWPEQGFGSSGRQPRSHTSCSIERSLWQTNPLSSLTKTSSNSFIFARVAVTQMLPLSVGNKGGNHICLHVKDIDTVDL